jgi:hypothetical protein
MAHSQTNQTMVEPNRARKLDMWRLRVFLPCNQGRMAHSLPVRSVVVPVLEDRVDIVLFRFVLCMFLRSMLCMPLDWGQL